MKRIFKRLRELRYRFDNYRWFRAHGLSMARAWKKADQTLNP